MFNWKERYQRWLRFSEADRELQETLESLQGNEQMLEDCFYKHLEFGTGGIRGELGPGPNRLNIYTVRRISEGLARYIEEHGEPAKQSGVAIAYDSRCKSSDFARGAAQVFASHGIRVYFFDRLCPTPLLSYAVRFVKAFAGIVITASHNPPEYNGYKIYGADGGQITPVMADRINAKVNEVEDELSINVREEAELEKSGLLTLIDDRIEEAYISRLQTIRLHPPEAKVPTSLVNIVFTPLHGTSYEPMMKVLRRYGYRNVTVVREQADPDPNFSHAVSLNPEEHRSFELAIKYGKEANADLLIATDPDADRVGMAVKNDAEQYVVLTGNQTGALLLYYLLSTRKKAGMLPANGVILKTIVTTEMARAIALDFGMETVETLTGFKYIGEKISEYEKTGKYTFQFGFEESNGYVIGDFVRDKDGIQTALMMADMCACYKAQGKTIYEGLLELFGKYGFYHEDLYSITLRGKDGAEKISLIIDSFRQSPPTRIAGKEIAIIEDCLTGFSRDLNQSKAAEISLPKSNVLKFRLEDDSWFCLRPSGTEPKIKIYVGVKGASMEESGQRLACVKESVITLINGV